MKKCFRLFTWQNPDWDIIKEKRDPSKCLQRWGRDTWDRLQLLYKKLEKKVGTLDFIWCYAEYKYCAQPEISKLWVLDVPSSKIFHVLDSKIWDQAVHSNKQPVHISWDKLIGERSERINKLSAGNNNDITPLVCVPLCTSIQVIDERFSVGPVCAKLGYQELPTSECEAKRCRDEGCKKGGWRQQCPG